jgi:hypothetical protein
MSSRKKPRPLFDVPVDIDGGRESGWVYRSAVHEPRVSSGSGSSLFESGSLTLALGIAAIAQTIMLGLTVAAIPMTLGMRALHSFSDPDR